MRTSWLRIGSLLSLYLATGLLLGEQAFANGFAISAPPSFLTPRARTQLQEQATACEQRTTPAEKATCYEGHANQYNRRAISNWNSFWSRVPVSLRRDIAEQCQDTNANSNNFYQEYGCAMEAAQDLFNVLSNRQRVDGAAASSSEADRREFVAQFNAAKASLGEAFVSQWLGGHFAARCVATRSTAQAMAEQSVTQLAEQTRCPAPRNLYEQRMPRFLTVAAREAARGGGRRGSRPGTGDSAPGTDSPGAEGSAAAVASRSGTGTSGNGPGSGQRGTGTGGGGSAGDASGAGGEGTGTAGGRGSTGSGERTAFVPSEGSATGQAGGRAGSEGSSRQGTADGRDSTTAGRGEVRRNGAEIGASSSSDSRRSSGRSYGLPTQGRGVDQELTAAQRFLQDLVGPATAPEDDCSSRSNTSCGTSGEPALGSEVEVTNLAMFRGQQDEIALAATRLEVKRAIDAYFNAIDLQGTWTTAQRRGAVTALNSSCGNPQLTQFIRDYSGQKVSDPDFSANTETSDAAQRRQEYVAGATETVGVLNTMDRNIGYMESEFDRSELGSILEAWDRNLLAASVPCQTILRPIMGLAGTVEGMNDRTSSGKLCAERFTRGEARRSPAQIDRFRQAVQRDGQHFTYQVYTDTAGNPLSIDVVADRLADNFAQIASYEAQQEILAAASTRAGSASSQGAAAGISSPMAAPVGGAAPAQPSVETYNGVEVLLPPGVRIQTVNPMANFQPGQANDQMINNWCEFRKQKLQDLYTQRRDQLLRFPHLAIHTQGENPRPLYRQLRGRPETSIAAEVVRAVDGGARSNGRGNGSEFDRFYNDFNDSLSAALSNVGTQARGREAIDRTTSNASATLITLRNHVRELCHRPWASGMESLAREETRERLMGCSADDSSIPVGTSVALRDSLRDDCRLINREGPARCDLISRARRAVEDGENGSERTMLAVEGVMTGFDVAACMATAATLGTAGPAVTGLMSTIRGTTVAGMRTLAGDALTAAARTVATRELRVQAARELLRLSAAGVRGTVRGTGQVLAHAGRGLRIGLPLGVGIGGYQITALTEQRNATEVRVALGDETREALQALDAQSGAIAGDTLQMIVAGAVVDAFIPGQGGFVDNWRQGRPGGGGHDLPANFNPGPDPWNQLVRTIDGSTVERLRNRPEVAQLIQTCGSNRNCMMTGMRNFISANPGALDAAPGTQLAGRGPGADATAPAVRITNPDEQVLAGVTRSRSDALRTQMGASVRRGEQALSGAGTRLTDSGRQLLQRVRRLTGGARRSAVDYGANVATILNDLENIGAFDSGRRAAAAAELGVSPAQLQQVIDSSVEALGRMRSEVQTSLVNRFGFTEAEVQAVLNRGLDADAPSGRTAVDGNAAYRRLVAALDDGDGNPNTHGEPGLCTAIRAAVRGSPGDCPLPAICR